MAHDTQPQCNVNVHIDGRDVSIECRTLMVCNRPTPLLSIADIDVYADRGQLAYLRDVLTDFLGDAIDVEPAPPALTLDRQLSDAFTLPVIAGGCEGLPAGARLPKPSLDVELEAWLSTTERDFPAAVEPVASDRGRRYDSRYMLWGGADVV